MPALAPALVDIDYELEEELARGRRDGSLIRNKARMLYEHFGLPALSDILQKVDQQPSLIFQAMRELARTGDLDPKANVVAGGGGNSFSLTIVANGAGQAPGLGPMQIIEQEPVTLKLSDPELPATPEGFKMPDFNLTRDLIGPPLAKDPT